MYVNSIKYRYSYISVCQLNHSPEGLLPPCQVCNNRSTQTSGRTHTLHECLYICLHTENSLYSHWIVCRASSWHEQILYSTSIKVSSILDSEYANYIHVQTSTHRYQFLLKDKISVSHIHPVCCHNVYDGLREIWFYHMYEVHSMMKHCPLWWQVIG